MAKSIKKFKEESIEAFVLAGGKSARMGRDKALLEIGGKPFIDRIIETLSEIFSRITVVGRIYKHPDLASSYQDILKGIGPIGGIYTALKKSTNELNFIIGLDYPLITEEIIEKIVSISLKKAEEYTAFIPVCSDGIHPLVSIYKKDAIPAIENLIERRIYRVNLLFSMIKTYYIDFTGIPNIEPEKAFFNLNTPKDYEEIERIMFNRAKNR